jgi:thioredoxin-related protein
MKKMIRLLGIMIAAAMMFTACSKKIKVDSTKWIDNLTDGKTAAAQENKKVILFFSADENDEVSSNLKAKVFNTDAFLNTLTPKYVLVNLDFSNSLFDKTQVEKTASKEDKKTAAALEAKLKDNMKQATFYNVQGSPAFYILTKEGYVVTPITVEGDLDSVDAFTKILDSKAEDIAKYDEMLAATKTGSKEDQIKAIDALYEKTEPQMRYLLSDLSKKLIKLDSKNKSGFVGKHILACANSEAMTAYLDQQPKQAAEAFAKAGKNKNLSADEKQQAFYTAGYLLGQSGSDDYKSMRKYFQASYDAKSDSEHADQIKQMISIVDNMEQQAAEEAKKTKDAKKTGKTSNGAAVEKSSEKPADAASASNGAVPADAASASNGAAPAAGSSADAAPKAAAKE